MTESPEDQAPRRAHSRLRLGMPARLETLDGRQKVRLINLSQGGAHLIASQPGDIRQAVLTWLRFEAFGTVAWSEGDHIGLEFDEPLPMAVLIETRQRAPAVVREEAMMTKEAARDWVAGKFNPGSER